MFAYAMGFVFLNQIVRRVLKLWDIKEAAQIEKETKFYILFQ